MKKHEHDLPEERDSGNYKEVIQAIIQSAKKIKTSFFLLVLCMTFLPSMKLLPHGFSGKTEVVGKQGIRRPIAEIADDLWSFPRVMSYSFKTHEVMRGKVKAAGHCLSNCYLRISFEEPRYIHDRSGESCIIRHPSDILCSPLQEFYLPKEEKWLPAYQLKTGTVLKSYYHGKKTVLTVELVEKEIELFILEVKRRHNFFVGSYGILVHNDAIPWQLSLGFSFSWGAGAIAGANGANPITIIAGAVIGGIAAYFIESGESKKVDFSVKPDILEELVRKQNAETGQTKERSHTRPHAPESQNLPEKKPDDDDPDPKKPKKFPPVPPSINNDHDKKTEVSNPNPSPTQNYKTKEDILAESRLVKVDKELIQYEKKGNYQDAVNDFKSLNPKVLRDIKNPNYPGREGWVGKDGETKITVRNISTTPDKAPTLEFRNENEKILKIRYKKD